MNGAYGILCDYVSERHVKQPMDLYFKVVWGHISYIHESDISFNSKFILPIETLSIYLYTNYGNA